MTETRALSAAAATWRDGVLTALQAYSDAQPRVESGPQGGQWTSGSEQTESSDQLAMELYKKMLGMTPAQRAAFLASLPPDQLARVGAFAAIGNSSDPTIGQIRNAVGDTMRSRGMDPGSVGLKPKGGKKKAAKKGGSKGKSSGGGSKGGGGGKSSGGGGKKSSGGGGGGGGGSKSSGGGSSSKKKSSSSSKAPAKKEPEPKPKPKPRTSPSVTPTPPRRPPRGPARPPSTQPVLRSSATPAELFRALVAERRG